MTIRYQRLLVDLLNLLENEMKNCDQKQKSIKGASSGDYSFWCGRESGASIIHEWLVHRLK